MSAELEPTGTFKRLADDKPVRHDLFLGLVAPLGSSRDAVLGLLKDMLDGYGYAFERVRLSDLLDSFPQLQGLPTREDPTYYARRMDAGDRLRRAAGDWSGLAAVAVGRCASLREEWMAKHKGLNKDSLPPRAYVFDSLKHPREARLFRSVYGPAYWQLGIVEDVADRLQNLAEDLAAQSGKFESTPDARAFGLIARDEGDPDAKHGQHVRDVFATSDFFLPVQRGVAWDDHLKRFVSGIFGAPLISPSADEEAMRLASAAALRSAAIGRQVGAAIVPALGSPILIGTNEVPKPGGGQFREGDIPDHRDFQGGYDPNPAYTERVIRELLDVLAKKNYFDEERNRAGGGLILAELTAEDSDGKSILDATRAKSLIEFTRCLHAEQAAIVEAARTGVSIADGRLYTTTFPCHECTKFIIGAGINQVHYIEPYPKSLAGDLYRDLIDPIAPLDSRDMKDKVPFVSFLGFSPNRFDDVFRAGKRKIGSALAVVDAARAAPIGTGWSEAGVRVLEDQVVVAVGKLRESEWPQDQSDDAKDVVGVGAEPSETKAPPADGEGSAVVGGAR